MKGAPHRGAPDSPTRRGPTETRRRAPAPPALPGRSLSPPRPRAEEQQSRQSRTSGPRLALLVAVIGMTPPFYSPRLFGLVATGLREAADSPSQLAEALNERQIRHAMEFLGACAPTKRARVSSFGLKQLAEKWPRGKHVSVSNGALIAAAMRLGLTVAPASRKNPTPNARIGVRVPICDKCKQPRFLCSLGLNCSFCGKSQKSVKKLVAGAGDGKTVVYICDECIGLCNDTIADQKKASTTSRPAAKSPTKPSCSFCGLSNDKTTYLIAGPAPLFICEGCINLCDEILAE
jgi:hypothetical protein